MFRCRPSIGNILKIAACDFNLRPSLEAAQMIEREIADSGRGIGCTGAIVAPMKPQNDIGERLLDNVINSHGIAKDPPDDGSKTVLLCQIQLLNIQETGIHR
jgi:hypothetical protein